MEKEDKIKKIHKEYEHKEHAKYEEKYFSKKKLNLIFIGLLTIGTFLILFNQIQINQISNLNNNLLPGSSTQRNFDLGSVDLSSIKSTGNSIATVFPVTKWQTGEDVMADMFPTGTPDYGAELGVSFDEPVKSLETLSKMYRGLKQEVESNKPERWKKYMNLATKPVGISCEFCCGVGPIGVDKRGNSACGCQHNPALLSVALYLSAYTDYTDAEILKEVMKWKTLFFPKDMVKLGTSLIGGDASSSLKELPEMVGGC